MDDTADNHFSQFAASLSRRLAPYRLDPEFTKDERNRALLAVQRRQFTQLLDAEARFRDLLIEAGLADAIYTSFLAMIRTEKRNILAARSYFRERQKVFTGGPCTACHGPKRTCTACHGTGKVGISSAIASNDIALLMRYHPNVQFIQFALRSRRWTAKTERALARYEWWRPGDRRPAARPVRHEAKILDAVNTVFAIRSEIVESNIPLVIERALLFGRRTPPSHLTRMDLVQIAADGLMAGVDKLVLEAVGEDGVQAAWDGGDAEDVAFTKEPGSSFRSVAIGRMVGNLIEQYSATLLHFYPGDKRKLYRANKAARFDIREGLDFDKVAEAVNAEICKKCKGKDSKSCDACDGKGQVVVADSQRTTAAEISDLMGAASCVSVVDEEGTDQVGGFAAAESWRPDVQVERAEAVGRIRAAIQKLPLLEQKFMALCGIGF